VVPETRKGEKPYRFWGRHPAWYALSDYLTFLGRSGAIRGRAAESLGARKGSMVLELGCGTGINFRFIRAAVGGEGTIVGLDYSKEMLRAACELVLENGWSNVALVRGDAAAPGFAEEAFDGVLSVLALSAIPRWKDALVKCRAVLRPRGVLAVCDARPFDGPLRVLNPLVKAVYRPCTAWDPSRDIPEEMRKVFGDVKVEKFNMGTFFIATSIRID